MQGGWQKRCQGGTSIVPRIMPIFLNMLHPLSVRISEKLKGTDGSMVGVVVPGLFGCRNY